MSQIDPYSNVDNFIADIERNIQTILDRDLCYAAVEMRSVEAWLERFENNPDYKETKELLLCLKVLLVDEEIVNLKNSQEVMV